MTNDHFRFRRGRVTMHASARAEPMEPESCSPKSPLHALPSRTAHRSHSTTLDGLGATHWQVIDRVRERYFRLGALPVMRLVCRSVQLDPRAAHGLFRNCRSLWFVAGLPDPGEEARAYMN